jgi:hypothetical protein
VIVHKTSKVHATHYFALEWIDCLKRMIVLQELDELDCNLELIKADVLVDNKKWRNWKDLYNISTRSYNVLFS